MNNFQSNSEKFIPPCGIYCGTCPNFTRERNKCKGYASACKARKCKSIYICCVEKKGLEFCHQCKIFPCSRFKKFAATWLKYKQDLLKNQEEIKQFEKSKFIEKQNTKTQSSN